MRIYGHCVIESLILECCLENHGIKSELVKDYIIVGDLVWQLHIWNKIYLLGGEIKQIDVVYNPGKDLNVLVQHTLKLKDKWKSSIETQEERQEYNRIVEFMRIYQKNGREDALRYFKKYKQEKIIIHWEWVFGFISQLKTFQNVGKCKNIILN